MSRSTRSDSDNPTLADAEVADLANVRLSLKDLLGERFVEATMRATAATTGASFNDLASLASEPIDFLPSDFAQRADEMLEMVGRQICEPLEDSDIGAPTDSFARATKPQMAPLSGYGCVRVGQDGKGYLISKSEHYHASLGHRFPGFKLVEIAEQLGVDNTTHNNTRGYITRLAERYLVAACNGVDPQDLSQMNEILESTEQHLLNRVINLQTGSLAVEAGVKMMLARFYSPDQSGAEPRYGGRVPVFIVIGDQDGGTTANYHGTTITTQLMRGLWPTFYEKLREHDLLLVQPVRINDLRSFEAAVRTYNSGKYRIAGFLHEIVLMNYGSILLESEYLQRVYSICHQEDIPILVDEIQSCIWSAEYLLFREYNLSPDFVAAGKGFPAGRAAGSRIVTTAEMDSLSQFGALVTNGQEELGSLAYLISMAFVRGNGAAIHSLGEYYEAGLKNLATNYPSLIRGVQGLRHMSGLVFADRSACDRFVGEMNSRGFDISAQSYKLATLPVALTKLPIVASRATIDLLLSETNAVLATL